MRGKLAKKLRKIAYREFDASWEGIRIVEMRNREIDNPRYSHPIGNADRRLISGTYFYPAHAARRHYQLLKRA